MLFMNFLKSLDDLLYEIITWIVFYPVTLWRSVRRPFQMMTYADSELRDTPEKQYPDVLSPPLFLLLTLLVSHAIELAVVGQSSLVADKQGLAGLVSDDTSLLLIRLIFFAVFPLIMAVSLLNRQHRKLTRDSLKPPFYAQCYPAGVFALVLGIGGLLSQLHAGPAATLIGAAVIVAAFLWYGTLQTLWFKRALGISLPASFGIATLTMIACLLVFVLLAALLT
ncbi:hypothetical protein HZY97_04660 [Sphingomonas sp. R-74633]|uniref:hypothetical protein n=1 Tax=Sphingomonas sp. R-74633 TaxID=2751188 RepID=UPI0015D3873F|nr:hypothetical protein [Sphingomonas sp. R-74633]NYT40036.1 hypothetical protein [Sphingomonas sp. R-74633]